ncbi:TIGR02147 family protein [Bdellovibrio sp. 22V]|uniref:TIGR02147 family protein n=1 Tax=Bdellovibrio TaxID=958 RepID=UPI002543178B|nr:TIGR02147 family protein [Bdellovibrio sp. 22V]WII73932.1 TIGR02147 family protein [Bdellovibrio sp. 22V]
MICYNQTLTETQPKGLAFFFAIVAQGQSFYHQRMTDMTSIYEYREYREFLHDKFIFLKSTYKKMSLEFLAKKIGISKSFMKMVLDGERHLAIDKLANVAKAFELSRSEKSYFVFMACQNMMEDKEMSSFFEDILKILRIHQGAYFPSAEEIKVERSVYASALSMTIQTMRLLPEYQDDAHWIKEQLMDPKVTLKEIEEVLASLQKNEVAPENFQGVLYPSQDGFMRVRMGLKLAAEMCAAPKTFMPAKAFMCTYTLDDQTEKKAFEIFSDMHDRLEALEKNTKTPTMVLFASDTLFCVADTKKLKK